MGVPKNVQAVIYYHIKSDGGGICMVIFLLWLAVVLALNEGVAIFAVALIVGVVLGLISAILDLL